MQPFCPWSRALTFTARVSYRLGRHLNTSALPQPRASHTLGQPQPQPFKYFDFYIFREVSLILSPRSFSSFMLRLIYQLRENNLYPFFIWGCLYTATKIVVPFGWLLNDLLDHLEYVTTLYLGYSDMATGYNKQNSLEWPYAFFLTLLAEIQTQYWRERLFHYH